MANVNTSASEEALERLLQQVSKTPPVLGLRTPLKSGDRLASGRFHVLDELGKGGMGSVFAARDERRGECIALKAVGRVTPQAIVQLKQEFRVASELVHRHIVRLYELFRDGTEWFFTMELVRGEELPAILEKTPCERHADFVREVAGQLATAVHAVHGTGAIHGDLKPSNFLIENAAERLRVVLLDFGLAQPFGNSAGGGTYAYMAPEQLLGHGVTESADWYSFGVVLHEALTGKLPRFGTPSARLAEFPRDLRELCTTLLEQAPDRRPSGASVLNMLGLAPASSTTTYPPPTRSRLIGRRREVLAFYEAREAASGTPAIVLVQGPAGIGKTSFVEHVIQAERARGAVVLRARCRENESIGYNAVDGLVDDIVNLLAEMSDDEVAAVLPRSVADLVQLFPALRGAKGVPDAEPEGVQRNDQALVRQRAIVAFAELLRNLGSLGPVVLWVDDLQWSDTESALILGPVLGGADPVPLLFIGSHRMDGSNSVPVMRALYSDPSLNVRPPTELMLAALGDEEATKMALDLLPLDLPDVEQRAQHIARDAAGLPLFITELVNTARTAPASLGAQSELSLGALIERRVRELPVAAQHVLELIAVAGAPLSRATLKGAQRLPSSELDSAIGVLRANRLVVTNGIQDEHTIDVRHDRFREFVWNGLAEGERKRHHLALAAVFEAGAGKPEEIAAHYQGAGELSRAATYWLAAAEESAKALAFKKSADYYDRALKRAELDLRERHRIELRRAEMLAYSGEGASAAALYLSMAARSPPSEAVELQRQAAEQLLLSGKIQEGLRVIEDVLSATGMPRSQGGRRALPSVVLGRVRLRLRGLKYRLRAESELPHSELVRLDAAWTIACSMGFVDYIRGADFQNRHLLLALRAGEPRRLARALALEALNAAAPAGGSRRRSDQLLRVSESLVEKIEDQDHALGLLSLARGVAAYLHGDTESAVVNCSQAVDRLTLRCAGAVWERVTGHRFLIASLFYSGQFGRLGEVVPRLLAEAEGTANLYSKQFFRSGYSIVAWLARDDVAEARRQLSLARDEWQSETYQLPEYNRLVAGTYIKLYAGEMYEALEELERRWPTIEEAQLFRISIVKVQLWHLRGSAAVGAAQIARRRRDLVAQQRFLGEAQRCAKVLRRDKQRRAAPVAAVIEAAVDFAAGSPKAAKRKLDVAADSFDQLGMKLFAAAVRVNIGCLQGAPVGSGPASAAEQAFLIQNVVAPQKMIRMLVPGFGDV